MAINIFQGGTKSSKSTRSNSAARSVRAANAQAALSAPSVTSDSGATAVGKTGTLSKVGNVVGKVAGIASKFLPGIGGTIAKGIAGIFNDPEWWQSVPGDAVTLNAPLREVEVGQRSAPNLPSFTKPRFAFCEFVSTIPVTDATHVYVIQPTAQQITQYLLPEIRKVVNAIPLQSAKSYAQVLQANATLYALWQNLKRYDYLLKHGQTYIANLDDDAFPILQVANAATLQSTIGRLEEYLRANVRLPHTLCEYLAWRFGRVYKSNNSAKAALVMYNVLSVGSSIAQYTDAIADMMALISSTASLQQANADLYNAYYDHDFMVEVRDDTQFRYDAKEFCLRTNTDIRAVWPDNDTLEPLDCVYLDSSLDNPTTYMASTVSTVGAIGDSNTISWLFPVRLCNAWIPFRSSNLNVGDTTVGSYPSATGYSPAVLESRPVPTSLWGYFAVDEIHQASIGPETASSLSRILATAIVCKSLDIYNKDVYVTCYLGDAAANACPFDVTVLSMDMGLVQNTVLGNEHVYAFANLVHVGRKHSMSYKEAETLVSRDVANLVEKLDIATAK